MRLAIPLNDNQKASARAEVLKESVHFCRKRLVDPADDLSTVLERLGQPFQDLVAAYRFTGPHQELLDHCLRILVGNDLVHAKYDDRLPRGCTSCQTPGSCRHTWHAPSHYQPKSEGNGPEVPDEGP